MIQKLVHKLRASDRGANAVEFALIAPILLLVVFGIFEFGRIFNQYIIITNASREGARYAVVCSSCTVADVQTRTAQAGGGVSLQPSQVTVLGFPGVKGDYITVSVTHPMTIIAPLMGVFFPPSGTLTLLATTSMFVER